MNEGYVNKWPTPSLCYGQFSKQNVSMQRARIIRIIIKGQYSAREAA